MGIGIMATARTDNWSAVSDTVQALADQSGYPCWSSETGIRMDLCYNRSMYLEHRDGEVVVDCQTNVAGPGFHAAAVAFLDKLAERSGLEFSVDDETDYYKNRDFARMRTEHFHSWLDNLVKVINQRTQEMSSLSICWDMGQYQPENVPGTVVSPMGRYDVQALVQRIEQEGIATFAQDFFFWNEPELDAWYYRNVAINRLWEDCYFQPSERSELDNEVNRNIIELLERAAGMDRSMPFPREAYAEVCRLAGRTPMDVSDMSDYVFDYPVGYRKGEVRHRLGNLTMPMHGSFLYSFEDEENRSSSHIYYNAQEDGWRNLRVTAFVGQEERTESFDEDIFAGALKEPETFPVGEGMCMAALAGRIEDEDEIYYQVVAEVLSGKQITLLTLSFQKEEDEAWAMELLRGIQAKLPRK